MEQYLNKMKQLKKDSAYKKYSYEYFSKTLNGMERNDEVNLYFGTSRVGYEKFKKENDDSFVGYANTYIREVTDKVTNTVNGYILETQIHPNPDFENANKLYIESFDFFCKNMKVTDTKALLVYMDRNSSRGETTIDSYYQKLELLAEIMEDYNYDAEFKLMFDKIIN